MSLTGNFTDIDLINFNGVMYVSNHLHDYLLSNFFVAYAIGMLIGVILGLNAYIITEYIKSNIERD